MIAATGCRSVASAVDRAATVRGQLLDHSLRRLGGDGAQPGIRRAEDLHRQPPASSSVRSHVAGAPAPTPQAPALVPGADRVEHVQHGVDGGGIPALLESRAHLHQPQGQAPS